MSQDFSRELEAARGQGNLEPIGSLVEASRAWLHSKAKQLLATRPLAQASEDDLVQETVLKAVLNFSQFAGQSEREFRAWLAAILEHTLENLRRYHAGKKRDHRREVSDSWPEGESLFSQLAKADPTPSSQARRREWDALVRQAIDKLPDRYREAVLLRDGEELSFPEIGQRLGCSEDAARKLFRRAVEMLRAQLASSRQ